jgi:hypothetical protein
MRVESSMVSYAAEHSSVSATVAIDETFVRTLPPDSVELSDSAMAAVSDDLDDLEGLDPKQRLAVLILERMLGQRIQWRRAEEAATVPARRTVVMRRRTEVHSESEQTSFRARGLVETSDGRGIRFSVSLRMEREFVSVGSAGGAGNTTDPLVVNFGGAPARLGGAKVSFDLTADGKPEEISFVAQGSGFLVLDGNGDGRANDGAELFGPVSGNGYAELAAYDADGNGWIDEGDPVFGKLRIWTREGFYSLAEKGIGAIGASSVETPFAIRDGANSSLGNVRRTGVFLGENGSAGTVQEVELAS